MNEFKPVTYSDGYLPIEDHGLIGDGSTAALVGRDGAISWMRAPRFDSRPLFCRLLDARRGAFTVAPECPIEALHRLGVIVRGLIEGGLAPQSQRASINAENVMGIKWKLTRGANRFHCAQLQSTYE